MDRFEQIPAAIKKENEKRMQFCTESWNVIGTLRLVGYNKENVFHGARPMLSLVNRAHEALFGKFIQNATIYLIKQKAGKDGVLIDDHDYQKQLGTAMPHKELRTTVVKLNTEFIDLFPNTFRIGDIFRVEAYISPKVYHFWQTKKYEGSEMFERTRDAENETVSHERFKGFIKQRAMDPEEILSLRDKSTVADCLSHKQRKALKMALNEQRKLVCIQGPPGSGKTFTLAVLIAKLMEPTGQEEIPKKVIVLTPTREALKKIMAAARNAIEKIVPVRLHQYCLMDQTTFSKILEESPEQKKLSEKIETLEQNALDGHMSRENYQHMKNNMVNSQYREIMTNIMKNVRVLFSTINSEFVSRVTQNNDFENALCIIDEAAQVKETETWPAILKMSRVILVGDPYQLSPLIVSEEGRKSGLKYSLMKRIMRHKKKYSWIKLRKQYRSHEAITEWSNRTFYDNRIKTVMEKNDSLRNQVSLPLRDPFHRLFNPFVFVDTSYEFDEYNENFKTFEVPMKIEERHSVSDGLSYCNPREAEIVVEHYVNLRRNGISQDDIAVMSPYRGQREKFRELFERYIEERDNDRRMPFIDFSRIKIGTVDSFQGQEFKIVIFSLVRSNPKYNLGFVQNLSRLNVAITRAKLQFMFVGNGIMLMKSRNEHIKRLFEIFIRDRNRFPPAFVFGRKFHFNPESRRNNFGLNLRDFMEHCKNWSDGGHMLQHCQEWNDIRMGLQSPKPRKRNADTREDFIPRKRARY